MESINDILENGRIDFRDTGILNLAYLGDAVWELLVRKYYVERNIETNLLSQKVKMLVNAKKQSEMYLELYDSLDDDARNVSKRARNAKIKSFPKSCTYMEYRNATAFEVLIAYYFMNKMGEKINEIFKNYIEGANQ